MSAHTRMFTCRIRFTNSMLMILRIDPYLDIFHFIYLAQMQLLSFSLLSNRSRSIDLILQYPLMIREGFRIRPLRSNLTSLAFEMYLVNRVNGIISCLFDIFAFQLLRVFYVLRLTKHFMCGILNYIWNDNFQILDEANVKYAKIRRSLACIAHE